MIFTKIIPFFSGCGIVEVGISFSEKTKFYN